MYFVKLNKILIIVVYLWVAAAFAQTLPQDLLECAQIEVKQKKYNKAIELYLQLWASTQNPNSLFNIAILKYKQKKYKESEQYLKQYLSQSGVSNSSPQVIKLSELLAAQSNKDSSNDSSKQQVISPKQTSSTVTDSSTRKTKKADLVESNRHQFSTTSTSNRQKTVINAPAEPTRPMTKLNDASFANQSSKLQMSDWVKPTLYGLASVGILTSVGLYYYAHTHWSDRSASNYLERLETRNTSKTLLWSGDGLLVSSLILLTYTLFLDDPPDKITKAGGTALISNQYQILSDGRSVSLSFSF